ncbi:primosomal protein N' [Thiococcus pfennigii]|nr:primosomal protein N' [Thiococcus pfennigii]MBK1731314.1 primosomal protein N' [Thiococcus pfennigii]
MRVAVAAPVPEPFDYLPPSAPGAPLPGPGQRVLVPFGRGRRVGLIVALAEVASVPPERLKPVIEVLDERPLLAEADLAFLCWAADYYQHALGEALFSALPARLRRSAPCSGSAAAPGERGWRLTEAGTAVVLDDIKRAPRQAQVLTHLRALGGEAPAADLARDLGECAAVLRALARRGWVAPCRIEAGTPPPMLGAGPTLNADQQAAVDQVGGAFGSFAPFLLEGVTASGKTEVYIRLLEAAIAAGRQALVLVPEIGLTPQLERRFAARLGGTMAVLHSGLAEGERERVWRRAAAGEVDLLLGTRSAVFVPLPRLGLILVDEEHDLSLKQQEGFRYSGRDLAVRRAQQAACPVVLGSATPSLESLANAHAGRYRWLRLHRRASGAAAPSVTLIDIRAQPLEAGLSPPLMQLAAEQLAAGNQVLLFLNRRGFAPVLTCHDCGWVGECPRCDARLTLHRASGELRCHHCGLIRPAPGRCPSCGRPDLRPLGQGTERVEEILARRFPGLPLARVDRDSTRRKGELTRLLSAARRGEYRLLLGTQMLTKGHHFPGVTLVGVLDADAGLYGADYRAPERMAQLLVQVTGRAGRAERPGRVVVQTRHPEHPLLVSLLREGYPAFAEAALAERRAAGLPPFSHQALLRAEAGAADEALAFLRAAAAAGAPDAGEVVLWGPAPAPMERRAGRWRAQLLVQAPRRAALRRFLADWLPRVRQVEGAGRVRWSIDVDPQEMA